MCGRYSFFTDEQSREMQRIVSEIERKYPGRNGKTGEIYPTELVPVLVKGKTKLTPVLGKWGFPSPRGKGVIINARAETAGEKPMFRESLRGRRCVVPSTGFYEWSHDGQHTQYWFRSPDSPMLYMAGLFCEFQGEMRVVILTTQANPSVADLHNRMPLILPLARLLEWVFDDDKAAAFLRAQPPLLERFPVS